MFFLPIVIVGMLFLIGFDPVLTDYRTLIIIGLWIVLVLNAMSFSLDSILLSKNFLNNVKEKSREGFPIDSIEGFSEVESSFKSINKSGIIISLASLLSLITFLSGLFLTQDSPDTKLLFQFIALGLVLITIGIVLIIKIPEEPAFKPGGLIGFYLPYKLPTSLDNILSDVFFAYLDPATRIKYDDWTKLIADSLHPNFQSHKEFETRVDRARENILLLYYLSERMSSVYTDEVVERELKEVIAEEHYATFITGGESQITRQIFKRLKKILYKYTPEIFMLIDQLIVQLVDNLEDFSKKDLFVRISVPKEHKGNTPFQMLVFLFNNSKEFRDKKRPIDVSYNSDKEKLFPYRSEISLLLDESASLGIEDKKELPLHSADELDILEVLTKILQVGDAYWLQIKPKAYGDTIISVSVSENNHKIAGTNQIVKLNRDLAFIVKSYGSKLSFLGGLAAPLLSRFRDFFGI